MADWTERAACRGHTDVMFPDQSGVPGRLQARRAKKFCAECSVVDECRAFFYTLPMYQRTGIWFGTSDADRRHLKDRRCRTCGKWFQTIKAWHCSDECRMQAWRGVS